MMNVKLACWKAALLESWKVHLYSEPHLASVVMAERMRLTTVEAVKLLEDMLASMKKVPT